MPVKCSNCVESPDWGGFYVCIGCGNALCYPCMKRNKDNSVPFQEFESFYYDNPSNDENGHGVSWYICNNCLQWHPNVLIDELVDIQNTLDYHEKQVENLNKQLTEFISNSFPTYKNYITERYVTRRLIATIRSNED